MNENRVVAGRSKAYKGGKGGNGNYPTLVKYAQKTPLFPYVSNQRSMLYIENLVEFVRLMIINEERETFFLKIVNVVIRVSW